MTELTQLYPQPMQTLALEGTYLAHDLRRYAQESGKAFVYSNFVVSIDGRIAIPHADGKGLRVPPATANDRDWRLYQELAAQADILISSSRYLHEQAEGKAQEILQIDDPKFADLRNWRKRHGLSPQADIAVVSHKLDFPIPDVLTANGRKLVIFTTEQADAKKIKALTSDWVQVIVAGKDEVDGAAMVAHMIERGYHTIYSGAGPQIMHLLVKANVLNRLYVTQANKLLGGDPYAGIVDGDLFDPPVNLKLNTLYFDAAGLDGLGQLFMSYDAV
ncbi:MAG: dihydrofolate reductase family protein [Chloroflexota bacterium]